MSFSKCEYRAKNEIKKEFELTKDEFKKIKLNNCYLCGKINTSTHTNGIDRINNSIGYTVENSRACCKTCNYTKNSYDLLDVLMKFKDICNNNDKIVDIITNEQILELYGRLTNINYFK